jgi:hypothetical protein
VLVACALAACGSERSAAEATRSASAGESSSRAPLVPASTERTGRDACPLDIPISSLIAQELDQGAALLFTTRGDVEALRRAVASLAPLPGLPAPRLDKVENGIRLVFEATSASDTPKLQAAVSQHARDLVKRCLLIPRAPEEDESEEERAPSPPPPRPRMPSSPAPRAPSKPPADAGTSASKPERADAAAPPAKPAPPDSGPQKIKTERPAEKLDAGHLPDASPRP